MNVHPPGLEPFRRAIERQILRVLGPGDDVEDTVQDVFASALSSLGGLRDATCLPAWIQQIAVRTGVRQVRKRQRLRLTDLVGHSYDELVGLNQVVWPNAEARLDMERARRALLQLPKGAVTAWISRRVEGDPLDAIVAELGISRATVKRWIGGVDESLRRVLEGGRPHRNLRT